MPSIEDAKSLPRHRQLAAGAGLLLFICLFFPWVTVSFGGFSASDSGWNGIGTIAGIFAIALIAWEALRLLGQDPKLGVSPDLVTAGLAGLTALFSLIQFIRSLTQPDPAGPGFGAFLILICAAGLGYAAWLSFQAAGGAEAINAAKNDPDATPPATGS